MELNDSVASLAALAHSTRLEVFRLLVKCEPDGLAAGDVARSFGIPQNTMSSHLAILTRANLLTAKRSGRSIVYRADLGHMQRLMLFMLKDCCGGRPDLCTPLIETLTVCPPSRKVRAGA